LTVTPPEWDEARPDRYDTIGEQYGQRRRADPRIAAQIHAALGGAERIVNVGAGAGSYEPRQRAVVAVEPAAVMIAQRPSGSAPAVQAMAEDLPFADHSFDAALALMTIHHWSDVRAGLAELRRVARRQVVFTYEPTEHDAMWVFAEYFQVATNVPGGMPAAAVVEALGGGRVEVVPVPFDCTDGFTVAYWRRPEQYLSAAVRCSMSSLARLGDAALVDGIGQLADDLESGAWHVRHADLLDRQWLDAGLRLVVSGADG
jgi:SAM-dependent methyltransferase